MDKSVINDVLKFYDCGKLQALKLLTKGYANQNFKVETDNGSVLFRFVKQSSEAELLHEFKVLEYLKSKSFPAGFPIRRKDGNYINFTSNGKVVLYEFVEGEEPEINAFTVAEIGKAIGQLGKIDPSDFYRVNSIISCEGAEKLIEKFESAANQYPEVFEEYIQLFEGLKWKLNLALPSGIVHGDIYTDNTIFKGNKLKAIIDFEMVCTDHFLYEIGMTANGFCYRGEALDKELLQVLIENYERIRPLTTQERKFLPHYIKWASVGMAGWHLDHDLMNNFNQKQMDRVQMFFQRAKSILNYF